MKKIEMSVECEACNGTGVYSGIGESDGAGVVCYECAGTGLRKYDFEYKEFTGRKTRDDIKRVYKRNYGYKIGLGKVAFGGDIGEVNMDTEGVSYEEFLAGAMPDDIRAMACPMLADIGACEQIDGFIDICEDEHGLYIGTRITECPNRCNKIECWKRFDEGIKNELQD